MKFTRFVLGAMWLIASSVSAQEIDKLAWMAGTWTQTKDGEIAQEAWLGPRGKMMAAVNLTTSTKRGATFEFLRIVEGASGLSYLASPGGKAPAEFKLKTLGKSESCLKIWLTIFHSESSIGWKPTAR